VSCVSVSLHWPSLEILDKCVSDVDYIITGIKIMHSIQQQAQHAWGVPNVKGFSYLGEGNQKQVDITEGLGAFEDLINNGFLKPHTRLLDLGGGAYDDGKDYLAERAIEAAIYDPFMRTDEYNQETLQWLEKQPVDAVTSNGVLNVINTDAARLQHIQQAYDSLKPGGLALFKVWSGDNSGIPLTELGRFQSNREAATYLNEVRSVFGDIGVSLHEDSKLICAQKSD
jgi:SAM-dependent methyltransferase